MNRKLKALAVAAGLGTGLALVTAVPASAATDEQTFTCDGQQFVIRTNNNHSSDMGGWSAAKIVDGGSGGYIPTSFTFSAVDLTTGQQLVDGSTPKGNGNANQNQSTVTCTESFSGTLADLLDPGEAPPPGAALTDLATMTFTVTAVHHP